MNFKRIVRIFYPQRCPKCKEIIPLDRDFCTCYKDTIKYIGSPYCKHCGNAEANCTCSNENGIYFDDIVGVYYYEGIIQARLHNLKFNSDRSEAKFFYKEMAERFLSTHTGVNIDVITFIPMTEKDEKKRGFNQSELLCDGVAKILKLPSVELLVKLKETKSQHTLNEKERHSNLENCFFASDKKEIEGKSVLLIDDIKTTGSTLKKCTEKLLSCGAKEVYCLVAAITEFNTDIFN